MANSLLGLLATLAIFGTPASDPETTIRGFVKAFIGGDMVQASGWVKGGSATPELQQMGAMLKSQKIAMAVDSVKTTMTGLKAKAQVQTTTTSPVKRIENETVFLEKVGTNWLILPPAKTAEGYKSMPVNSMAILFTAGMTPLFIDAGKAAKATQSLNNVKQLTLATIMLAADQGDVVKTTVAGWHKAIFPYSKNERIFKSPNDTGKADSYNLNPKMAKVAMTKVRSASLTVLVYEGSGGKLVFRHRGRAAVGFVDGSARLVTPEQAKTLVWKP